MLHWQLVLLAVSAASSDEISVAGAEFLKQSMHEAEKKQIEKYTMITDVNENLEALGDMFEAVGNGYCANVYRTRIHVSVTYKGTQDPATYENEKCETECHNMNQCAGYNSMETYCELIRASDKHYDGGIISSNQSNGVTCFRKKGTPVDPRTKSHWDTFGKLTFSIIVILVAAIGVTFLVYHLFWFFFPGGITPA